MSAVIRVAFASRAHFTLIEVSGEGYRVNGGAGIALSGLGGTVKVAASDSLRLVDSTRYGVSEDSRAYIARRLRAGLAELRVSDRLTVEVAGDIGSQCGVGSQTSIILATLEAASLLNGMDIEESVLVRASGRGGASGVGANTYFRGGYIFDLGRPKQEGERRESSDRMELVPRPPFVVSHIPTPNWQFLLLYPVGMKKVSLAAEDELFSRAMFTQSDAKDALYHVCSGLTAAVAESDFDVFCRALNAIQDTAWKREEWMLQGERAKRLRMRLFDIGADAVALSSLGPAIVIASQELGVIEKKIVDEGLGDVRRVAATNVGRTIERA